MFGAMRCGGLMLLLLVASGCESARPDRRTYSFARLQDCSPAQAFEAARLAVQERYRVDRVDPSARLVVSAPMEINQTPGGDQVGDAIGLPRRARSIARVQVTGSDNTCEIWSQVKLEKYETNDRALYAQEHAITDLPTETPVEREAATTDEQNAIWRPAGRVRKAERAILDAVREIVLEKRAADPAQP